ncbi:uncharacterized protein LOC143855874 [Tasmannia lanceolata]|uniref:uncharacterized protein LOC143855874 n=1 Tax=Tasmannia lanceolata TaxID=3420 RepID=UPI0040639690
MADIEAANKKAYEWICKIDKQNWASLFLKGRRFNIYTSNACEVSNVVLKNAIEYPIATLVEHTRRKASESFAKCRESSNRWKGPLASYAVKIIQSASDAGRRMNVSTLDLLLFQVSSKLHQDRVDLGDKTCSCRAFQTFEIPCAHAMAAIGFRKADAFDFTEKWYWSETLRDTYREVIDTTLDKLQWQQPEGRLLPIWST